MISREMLVPGQGSPLRCGTPSPPNRQVGRCISDRFDHFPGCEDGAPGTKTPATLSENASMIFSFDALDAPCMDAYTNSAVPFADGHYLMFPSMCVLRQMFLLILLLESCDW